jgi:leader peptidase (prepilin peptidase)/N-methyltransferase
MWPTRAGSTMSADLALIGGATIGMAIGALLIPATRRELASALARASDGISLARPADVRWHQVALILASGIIPGVVLFRGGWSIAALPPLLLFLGLVQLAYCDIKRRLLPRTMVHATTACVALSAVIAAAADNLWHGLFISLLCSVAFSAGFLAINLINPAWISFGDVRLAPVVGLGLAWINPMALVEGFFLANLLAAVVGIIMMLTHRGDRKSAMPFGFYMALATGAVLLIWS